MTTEHKYLIRGQLRDLHTVTQWKDGCVYRTRFIGRVVYNSDFVPLRPGDRNTVQVSISTREYDRIMSDR